MPYFIKNKFYSVSFDFFFPEARVSTPRADTETTINAITAVSSPVLGTSATADVLVTGVGVVFTVFAAAVFFEACEVVSEAVTDA